MTTPSSAAPSLPLTVIGGYLGAGKTTLVNRLLRSPGGRRIGVIVNDFGSVAVDADLLAGSTRDGDVIGLANGCVCCTVGAGLHEALATMAGRDLDHVVIEVSGVADPSVAAAWGTVPPFEQGGVIVLVAADQALSLRNDRYVGAEVHRQIAGADLLVVTKGDRCDAATRTAVDAWLDERSRAPRISVIDGDVPADVVLGGAVLGSAGGERTTPRSVGGTGGEGDRSIDHGGRYATWTWSSSEPIERADLDRLLAGLDDAVLRVKGRVHLADDSSVVVQVVGRTVDIRPSPDVHTGSNLVAITRSGVPNPFGSEFC